MAEEKTVYPGSIYFKLPNYRIIMVKKFVITFVAVLSLSATASAQHLLVDQAKKTISGVFPELDLKKIVTRTRTRRTT